MFSSMMMYMFLGVFRVSCVSLMPWLLIEGLFEHFFFFSKIPSVKWKWILRFLNDLEL